MKSILQQIHEITLCGGDQTCYVDMVVDYLDIVKESTVCFERLHDFRALPVAEDCMPSTHYYWRTTPQYIMQCLGSPCCFILCCHPRPLLMKELDHYTEAMLC